MWGYLFDLAQELFGNEEILLETIDEIRRNPYRTEKLYSLYADDSFPRDPESIHIGLHGFYFIILTNFFLFKISDFLALLSFYQTYQMREGKNSVE